MGSYSAVTVRDDGCCYIYDWKKQTWFKSNSIDETTQIQFHSSGLEESSIEDYSIPKSISILKLVLCSIVGLGVGLLIIGIVSARRISLLVKVFGIMSVTFVVGGTLLFYMVNQIIVQFYMQSEIDKCIMSSHTISAKINVAKLETIDWNVQRQNEYFSELCEIMQYRDESEYVHAELKDKDQRIVIQENTFHCLYLIQNNEIVLAVNDQLPANIPAEVMVDSALITALNKVKDKECTSFMYGVDDKKSEWIICITPIVNEQGKVVALQETGISKHQYTTDTNKNLRTIMWTVTAIEGAVGILLLLCMRILLVSLKKLHRAVEAVGQENFSICVPIKGRDEIAEISEAFNTMSGKIGNHTAHLHTLNQSYLRFLPSETLNAIGKKSVLSVNRNDYSKIERYILHINFIDFHSVTDAMKDDDAFAFVNNLSNTIMEQVFQHNGFVESYNQEAFICLFTQAEDAYHAGVEIVRQLHDIEQCPQVTLVLVKGDALLGVIGHEKRLGTLMISDALRLSKKLGQLAGYCGINFLRTDNINFSRIYPERELGIFNFEGKSYVIKECFEGDSITEFMNKKEYLTQFNTIIHNFYQEDFQECKRSSIEYLRLVKHETLIAKYLFLCEHNLIHPDEPLGLESIND